jgi:hypothetical protein
MPKALTPIERRVLAYLDQRGPTHRSSMVVDLAAPNTKWGQAAQGKSAPRGNGAVPFIAGKWCARLIRAGYVIAHYDRQGYYRHHEVTPEGRRKLREAVDG